MTRASTTFKKSDVELLDFMITTLLRGGDPKMAMQHEAFASVARKIASMKASIARQKAKDR